MTITIFFIGSITIEPLVAVVMIVAAVITYTIKRGYNRARHVTELTYKQGRYV